MKRETALRYASEIARRVHAVNGLLATPGCHREAVRIKRVWVFGSTVKGSENPNDLDVLIDISSVGRRRAPSVAKCEWAHLHDGLLDRRAYHSYRDIKSPESEEYALKWLTKGMRMVSRHTTFWEAAAPFKEQVLIYPRWDMQ